MFKIFNRIETWETLERRHGPLIWSTVDLEAVDSTLSDLMVGGVPIYSAAYIIPTPRFGALRKHSNHLKLIVRMMDECVFEQIHNASDMKSVYETLMRYPGLGRFLSFQFAIDLNYSTLISFDEEKFVVAGPGAIDGISKCFSDAGGLSPEDIIYWVTERQEDELAKRNIDFPGLFGRRLQPVDCQNLFCEVSKYARVSHPDFLGLAKRRRIKQVYRRSDRSIARPFFPPRWKLPVPDSLAHLNGIHAQDQLPLL